MLYDVGLTESQKLKTIIQTKEQNAFCHDRNLICSVYQIAMAYDYVYIAF